MSVIKISSICNKINMQSLNLQQFTYLFVFERDSVLNKNGDVQTKLQQ